MSTTPKLSDATNRIGPLVSPAKERVSFSPEAIAAARKLPEYADLQQMDDELSAEVPSKFAEALAQDAPSEEAPSEEAPELAQPPPAKPAEDVPLEETLAEEAPAEKASPPAEASVKEPAEESQVGKCQADNGEADSIGKLLRDFGKFSGSDQHSLATAQEEKFRALNECRQPDTRVQRLAHLARTSIDLNKRALGLRELNAEDIKEMERKLSEARSNQLELHGLSACFLEVGQSALTAAMLRKRLLIKDQEKDARVRIELEKAIEHERTEKLHEIQLAQERATKDAQEKMEASLHKRYQDDLRGIREAVVG